MEDMLVFMSPFEASKDNWGYMWVGFCDGKRFVVQGYEGAGDLFDVENGRYFFSTKDMDDRIPTKIQKLMVTPPLSSLYFMLNQYRQVSIEAVMQIIEKGFDIAKVERKREIYYLDEMPILEILPGGIISWMALEEKEKKMKEDEVVFEMDEYGDRKNRELVCDRDERFLFPIYLDSGIRSIEIDEAEMSVRATNRLKHAGFRDFGDLLKQIKSREDLYKIRNISPHTAHEILKTLFCCQFSLLDLKEQKEYASRLLELNGKKSTE